MASSATTVCLKSSQNILARTWIAYPQSIHYRAEKHFRPMQSLAYNPSTECLRSPANRAVHPSKLLYRSKNNMPPDRRQFHSARRLGQQAESAIPHISLHIAAASSGKGRKYQPEKSTIDFIPSQKNALGLEVQGTVYERRRNRPDSGEDAYFVAAVGGDSNTVALGVCDGVGGWQEQGINPSDFSHGLCSYMAQSALAWTNEKQKSDQIHPQKLLNIGYDDTLADNQIKAGGATGCVAVADGTGRIRTANLGDSGFVQLRLGAVHQYSNPQTHAFNTPYQMSKTPPEIMTQAAIFGGLPLNDAPDRADVSDHQLQHGDVVVFATDGIWDNLSSQDILEIVTGLMRARGAWERTDGKGFTANDNIAELVHSNMHNRNENASLQSLIASQIVGEAKSASLNRKRDGPFAKAVQREFPMDGWHGGKVDDITALVLVAVENKLQNDSMVKAKL